MTETPITEQSTLDSLRREVDRLAAALVAAEDEARHLRDEVTANVNEREAARAQVRSWQADLDRFRAQVRDVAIRVASENDWCNTGLNEVLDELGLERQAYGWKVTVEVTITSEYATDEDDASDVVATILSKDYHVEEYDLGEVTALTES